MTISIQKILVLLLALVFALGFSIAPALATSHEDAEDAELSDSVTTDDSDDASDDQMDESDEEMDDDSDMSMNDSMSDTSVSDKARIDQMQSLIAILKQLIKLLTAQTTGNMSAVGSIMKDHGDDSDDVSDADEDADDESDDDEDIDDESDDDADDLDDDSDDESDEDSDNDDADEPESHVFNVGGENFAFDVTEMHVKKGDTVTVNFTSNSGFHDWTVDEFEAATDQVSDTDGMTSVTFVADEAGTFEYYCSVGNHRAQGMVGSLIVDEM